VNNVSDVRQIEIHTTEPSVPGASGLEVEIVIVKFKKYKSPGSDQIPAELIQAGDEILVPVIYKFIAKAQENQMGLKLNGTDTSASGLH
jgi:hypothetical protein